MAFDEGLAHRVREHLGGQAGLTARQMFGGIGFMVDGNMCVGVIGDELIARVGPDGYEAGLARPGAREFDFTGRAMKGWVTVAPEALDDDESFAAWLEESLTFARSLPPK